MEAAFFDLDKTVIAKASLMAFAPDFHRAGLINRRSLIKGLWIQVVYVRFGASANRLASIRRSVLHLTRGWEQAQVRQIVADGLATVIDPITHLEAIESIEQHRAAGRRIYIVSAAPSEIVEPVARYLGVGRDEAIASRARVDADGRYTGHMETYAYGPAKAEIMRRVALRDGIDLSASWAYSDSATDLPMLEAVGHAVVVNPDRALRVTAQERGWPVERWERTGRPAVDTADVRTQREGAVRRAWLVGAPALAVGGGVTALWWARRDRGGPTAGRWLGTSVSAPGRLSWP